ncbi:MAG: hypothetical protein GF364_08605 [Candidatus Lokiarchaeota archaeon]|nr:hypothetical protein [Candidatus Lokiarchaeota archaeon]
MKIGVDGKGKVFFLVGIFVSMVFFGIINSEWRAAYITDVNNLGTNFGSIRDIEATYLKPIGDINGDNFPDVLIHDSHEKSLYINRSDTYSNITLYPDESYIINESIDILSAYEAFDNYGFSSMAVYTIKTDIEVPDFLWNLTFEDRDIFAVELMNDVNGDGIQDLFVSFGLVEPLPDMQEIIQSEGNTDLPNFLKNHHLFFKELFVVDNDSEYLMLTPNYSEYQFWIVSGVNGNILLRSDVEQVPIENSIIDMTYLNNSKNSETKFVLLTSNYSAPRYFSPIFYNQSDFRTTFFNWSSVDEPTQYGFNFGWNLIGLSLEPLEILWSRTIAEIAENDYYELHFQDLGINEISTGGGPVSVGSLPCNASIIRGSHLSLQTTGNHFILEIDTAVIDYYDTEDNLHFYMDGNKSVHLFYAYNSSNGFLMWKGNHTYNYLTNSIDLNGDGFGQINGYYSEDLNLSFILYRVSDGEIICKAKLPYNSSQLINGGNLATLNFILSNEDMIGEDAFFEIVGIGLNQSHYEKVNHLEYKDPIQLLRLNINDTSGITMKLSKVFESNINLQNYTISRELKNTNVDLDEDGYSDYILRVDNTSMQPDINIGDDNLDVDKNWCFISGNGVNLKSRNWVFSCSIGGKFNSITREKIDFRKFSEMVFFFHDPTNSEWISTIHIGSKELVYIQDVNNFKASTNFLDFFSGSKFIVYILIGLIGFCIIGFLRGFKKQERTEDNTDWKIRITVALLSCVTLLITLAMIYFFTQSMSYTIGYTTNVISPEGQLLWFIIIYPAVFGLLALIPKLYSKVAPYFAEKVFINSQLFLKKIFDKRKIKDYELIVVNIENRKRISRWARLNRLLLPLLISLTFGIFIYQGLGPDGFLFNLFGPPINLIDHPLTNPSTLGILTSDMVNANSLWIEMGRFARYCIQPMLIVYVIISFLIPGAWLLDDVGVCFYQKAVKYRAVSDIDSVSKWTLSLISGLFGFTAIVSFFGLFLPMLTGLDELLVNIEVLSDDPALFGVIILLVALIMFPILAGILLMYGAMSQMERDYKQNTVKMLDRLKKHEIDVRLKDLSPVLETDVDDQWYKDALKLSENNKEDRTISEEINNIKDIAKTEETTDNNNRRKTTNV